MPSRIDDSGMSGNLQTGIEDTLQALYQSTFDPVDFLNNTLTTTFFSSGSQSSSKNGRLAQVQAASSEIQTLLSKLNAHNSKCSNSLTQYTDEILRSGSRLAYEVEILRGDVNSLHDVMRDSLSDDVLMFAPSNSPNLVLQSASNEKSTESDVETATGMDGSGSQDPPFITQLRTLGQVKTRLESVIKVFGDALQWPMPPSELSVTSSMVSVDAPELGVIETKDDARAKEVSRKLRTEILDLMDSDGDDRAGLDAASQRVERLKSLAIVWKGTAEEKARNRFVESVSKLVEDRKKSLDVHSLQQRPRGDSTTQRSNSMPVRSGQGRTESSNPAAGLFRNFQKLRDEIYLD